MPKQTDHFVSPPGVLVKDPDDGKYYYLIDSERKPATKAQLRQLRRNEAYNRKLAQGKLGELSDILKIPQAMTTDSEHAKLINLVERYNKRFNAGVGWGFEVTEQAIPALEQSLKEDSTKPFDRWYKTLRIGERIY